MPASSLARAVVLGTLVVGCGDATVGTPGGRGYNGDPGDDAPGSGASPTRFDEPSAMPDGGAANAAATEAGAPAPSSGALSCTSCHGDATRVAVNGADPAVRSAPPKVALAAAAPGAHLAHVNKANGVAAPLACSSCHVVPTSTTHANGKVDLVFGALAKTGGATPTTDGASCSATYCHGTFAGGSAATPTWTGAAMTCTSCHGAPPATGDHGRNPHRNAGCQACHGAGYSASTVARATHVDGKKDVGGAGSRITAWNAATKSCSPQCHGTETW